MCAQPCASGWRGAVSSGLGRRSVGLGGSADPVNGGISRRPLTQCLRLTCQAKQRYATYRSVAKKLTKAVDSTTKSIRTWWEHPPEDVPGAQPRGAAAASRGVHTHLLRRGPDGVTSLAPPPVLRSPHFELRMEGLTRAPSLLAHGEGRAVLVESVHFVVPALHQPNEI